MLAHTGHLPGAPAARPRRPLGRGPGPRRRRPRRDPSCPAPGPTAPAAPPPATGSGSPPSRPPATARRRPTPALHPDGEKFSAPQAPRRAGGGGTDEGGGGGRGARARARRRPPGPCAPAHRCPPQPTTAHRCPPQPYAHAHHSPPLPFAPAHHSPPLPYAPAHRGPPRLARGGPGPVDQYMYPPRSLPSTYDHRSQRTEDPVRSPELKLRTGGLVVRWVTTCEYPLLYVLPFCRPSAGPAFWNAGRRPRGGTRTQPARGAPVDCWSARPQRRAGAPGHLSDDPASKTEHELARFGLRPIIAEAARGRALFMPWPGPPRRRRPSSSCPASGPRGPHAPPG